MSPRQGFGHGAPMTIGLAAVAVIGFKITATTATTATLPSVSLFFRGHQTFPVNIIYSSVVCVCCLRCR